MYADGACQTDPTSRPVLNCTQLLASSGGAVREEEGSMIQALVGLKEISKAVGGSVEDAIQDFAGVQKSWDRHVTLSENS